MVQSGSAWFSQERSSFQKNKKFHIEFTPPLGSLTKGKWVRDRMATKLPYLLLRTAKFCEITVKQHEI
jgi:hypothetical protein